jgi:hypothetical protein
MDKATFELDGVLYEVLPGKSRIFFEGQTIEVTPFDIAASPEVQEHLVKTKSGIIKKLSR